MNDSARQVKNKGLRALFCEHAEHCSRLIVDMDFQGMMKDSERKSLCSQIAFLYARNKQAAAPFRIELCGLHDAERHQLEKSGLDSWKQWGLTHSKQPFDLKRNASTMIYLTADAEEELTTLDPTKTYIIGGIVDRNRYKGVTLEKAKNLGIICRKFPIKNYLLTQDPSKQFCPKQVLTVNHVAGILIDFQATQDWCFAFSRNLPRRSYKDRTQPKFHVPKLDVVDRTVVVTQCTTMNGRAAADKYFCEKCNVILVSNEVEDLNEMIQKMRTVEGEEGPRPVVIGFRGDTSSEVDMARLQFIVLPYFSHLHALIICGSEPILDCWIQPVRALLTLVHPSMRLKREGYEGTKYYVASCTSLKRNNVESGKIVLNSCADGLVKSWCLELKKEMIAFDSTVAITVDS